MTDLSFRLNPSYTIPNAHCYRKKHSHDSARLNRKLDTAATGRMHMQLGQRFQVGSLSPRAQLLIPANSFLGALGMFSIVLKISSRSAFGLTILPPLVGIPLMGARRLHQLHQHAIKKLYWNH